MSKPVKKKIEGGVASPQMRLLTRKIGDKTLTVQYDDGGKGYAMQALDKQEAEYLSAVETSQRTVEDIMFELSTLHGTSERLKQDTCQKCGYRTLKERRNRMRIFGGLFWTASEPSPYKHCENCGHDQENNQYSYRDDDSFRRTAEHTIDRAKRLRAKYETQPPKTLLEESPRLKGDIDE